LGSRSVLSRHPHELSTVEFALDSLLKEAGFEPSVPRRRPASSWCRVSFAPTFPFAGDQAEAT
jgi:hypothetical protein